MAKTPIEKAQALKKKYLAKAARIIRREIRKAMEKDTSLSAFGDTESTQFTLKDGSKVSLWDYNGGELQYLENLYAEFYVGDVCAGSFTRPPIVEVINNFPDWAQHLHEYGFDESLTLDDVAAYHQFMASLKTDLGDGSLFLDYGNESPGFSHNPAFGLPCNVVRASYILHT